MNPNFTASNFVWTPVNYSGMQYASYILWLIPLPSSGCFTTYLCNYCPLCYIQCSSLTGRIGTKDNCWLENTNPTEEKGPKSSTNFSGVWIKVSHQLRVVSSLQRNREDSSFHRFIISHDRYLLFIYHQFSISAVISFCYLRPRVPSECYFQLE